MSQIMLRLTCTEGCDIAAHSVEVASASGKDCAPPGVAVTQKCPDDTPQKIYRKDVSDPNVHRLKSYFTRIGDVESLCVENHQSDNRKSDDAECIDPVKPPGSRIPYGISFQI